MRSIRRRAAIAALAATGAAALAAPLSAHAANPIVKLKVSGSAKFLTDSPALGFTNLAQMGTVPLDQQRWQVIDAPGPAVFYKNVATQKCLRANPATNLAVRTRACDTTDSAASREQQWILSGGRLANRARLIAVNPADSLTADFQNVNRAMKMAPFTGASNQTWSQFAA